MKMNFSSTTTGLYFTLPALRTFNAGSVVFRLHGIVIGVDYRHSWRLRIQMFVVRHNRRSLDSRAPIVYFAFVRVAFKEWAVIVDALGCGDQIIILRKGGISEGPGGFKMAHPRFLLFPTLFHQQRDSVLPSAQNRFDQLATSFPSPGKFRLEFFAETAASAKLDSLPDARALSGQHVWRDEVIAERFDWGRDKSIIALAVRVFQLPQPVELPLMPAYAGCKSWVELDRDVPVDNGRPVLSDVAFAAKLDAFRSALGDAATTRRP
jgi:hypothetical protein